MIERHGLPAADRHRALGDARVLWEFVQALYRELPADEVAAAVKRVMKTPSLPPQLAPDALDAIPEAPGVYRFYGLNALPLYIGKAKNLRERIGAHFSSDYRSATDQRLSVELSRIEFDETAGELGALIREAALVKSLLPAHNHALRRKAESGVLELGDEPGPPRFIVAAAVDPRELPGRYGPFGGKRQAREALRALAGEHALCWKALGLEQRQGPCFARQVRKCAGACVGEESAAAHHERLRAALAPHAIPAWPHAGPVAIRESDPLTGKGGRARRAGLVLAGHRARRRRAAGAGRGAAAGPVRRRHRAAADAHLRPRQARGAAAPGGRSPRRGRRRRRALAEPAATAA